LEQKVEAAEEDSDDDEDMAGDEPARRTKFLVPKYPMYPCVEIKKTFTVYGEVIVPDDYKIVEPSMSEERAIIEEVEMEQDEEGPPKKTIIKQVTVDVRCAVRFIDFEGRAAGDSMEKIIGRVAPKKLILIHGSDPAKTQLSEHCRTQIRGCKEVMIPVNGQCVDVSSGQNIFRVNLNPSFVQSLNFVKVGEDYEIAYAEGEVKIDYREAGVPILTKPSGPIQGHDDVFVGNPHIHDLRDALVRNRIRAEVINHVVVCCNGLVNVRKMDTGNQISVQGALCPEYFEIRNVLYGLYKIV
jgi:cleavage and polyadenylation specificity factor subunit 2